MRLETPPRPSRFAVSGFLCLPASRRERAAAPTGRPEPGGPCPTPPVVVMNRPDRSPVARTMYAFHGVQDKLADSSLLLLVLVSAGKVLGELVVIAEQGPDQYSDRHAHLLASLTK